MHKPFEPAALVPRYSFNWSEDIYERVHEKYARGLSSMREILGLSRQQVITYIAIPGPYWQILRMMAKLLNDVMMVQKIPQDVNVGLRKIHAKMLSVNLHALAMRLDAYLLNVDTEGAGSKGNCRVEATAEILQLSLFPTEAWECPN